MVVIFTENINPSPSHLFLQDFFKLPIPSLRVISTPWYIIYLTFLNYHKGHFLIKTVFFMMNSCSPYPWFSVLTHFYFWLIATGLIPDTLTLLDSHHTLVPTHPYAIILTPSFINYLKHIQALPPLISPTTPIYSKHKSSGYHTSIWGR